jgi:ferritin-like metal-binding protein YciE
MATEIETLKDLYIGNLKDLYSAENQITKALPKIIKKVTSPDLKKGLEDHLDQTMNQVERLNQIFEALGTNPRGKKCVGMEGVLEEGKEAMAEKVASSDLMDAALIAASQKVEHYEISGYGTARAFAKLLGENEAVDLLSQTLEEEKAADEKLTKLGMNIINIDAMQGQASSSMSRQRA